MTRTLAAVSVALALAASAHAQVEPAAGGLLARCDGLALALPDPGRGTVGIEVMGRPASAGYALSIEDGRTGQELPIPALRAPEARADQAAGVARWETDGLAGELRMRARPDCIELTVSAQNTRDQQRWLTLTLALPLPLDEPWSAWDGATETAEVAAPAIANGIAEVFPMACAWDDQRGLALGLQPHMMVSDMSQGCDPDAESPLFVSVKLVIDRGETESAGFVVYAFAPRFGWQDALERYYRLYPEWFTPREGVDPQLWGTGGYLRSGGSRLAWEEARRFRFGWDWGYAPYRFTGDWYAHAEHYDGAYGDLDAWHEEKRQEDEVEGRAAVALNYIIPQFVNVDMAREHFPDAFLRDQNGNLIMREGSWVKRDETITGGYYWGNSIQEHSLRCLTELAEERGVEGISFDNASGAGMRFGPGPENSPGRAFTPGEDGAVWAAEGISYAGHMDHVHALSNGEHRLMVAANGPRCLLTCFRTDVAMHEAAPYRQTDKVEAMRRLLGHKPLICWEDHPEGELEWQRMSPEELRTALRRDFEFWVMYGLYRGITPAAHRVRGNLILQRHLDELLAVQRAGWWPVPAMRADAGLWLGRFGEGTDTLLTLGNATGADVEAEVEVLTDYLGEGCWGLAAFDGSGGPAVESEGGLARMTLPIANRTTAVLRAPLQVVGVDGLTATCDELPVDPDTASTIRWRLTSPEAARVRVRHALSEGATPMFVRLNGAGDALQPGHQGIDVALSLPAGESVLEIGFVPAVTIQGRDRALDFPFVADGQATCQIVVSDDAPEQVRFAAERIAVYFEYWTAAQIKAGATPSTLSEVEERAVIPVVAEAAAGVPVVAVGLADLEQGAAFVAVDAGTPPTLQVLGADAEGVERAALSLLKVLDERYPYAGRMSVAGPLYEKAGIAGTFE